MREFRIKAIDLMEPIIDSYKKGDNDIILKASVFDDISWEISKINLTYGGYYSKVSFDKDTNEIIYKIGEPR